MNEADGIRIPTIGSVKAGQVVMVAVRGGSPVVIGAQGEGDRIGAAADEAAQAAEEARMASEATGQHFFADGSGIHMTEEEGSADSGHNVLVNSLGMLVRKGLIALASFTESAVSFFDGYGTSEENQTAHFGRSSARIGKVSEGYTRISPTGVEVFSSGDAEIAEVLRSPNLAGILPIGSAQPVVEVGDSGAAWTGENEGFSIPLEHAAPAGLVYRVSFRLSEVRDASGASWSPPYGYGVALASAGHAVGDAVSSVTDEDGAAVAYIHASEPFDGIELAFGRSTASGADSYHSGVVSDLVVEALLGAPERVASIGVDGFSLKGRIDVEGQDLRRSSSGHVRSYEKRTDMTFHRGLVPDATKYLRTLYVQDASGKSVAIDQTYLNENGKLWRTFGIQSFDENGENPVRNYINLGIDKDGLREVSFTSKTPWLDALLGAENASCTLASGWSASTFSARRRGRTVTLRARSLQPSSSKTYGTTAIQVATIPVGYAPAYDSSFAFKCANHYTGRVIVRADGAVLLAYVTNGSAYYSGSAAFQFDVTYNI